jgi:hypothetical protein
VMCRTSRFVFSIGWAGRGGHGVPRVGCRELRDRHRALRRRREDGDGRFTRSGCEPARVRRCGWWRLHNTALIAQTVPSTPRASPSRRAEQPT